MILHGPYWYVSLAPSEINIRGVRDILRSHRFRDCGNSGFQVEFSTEKSANEFFALIDAIHEDDDSGEEEELE